MDVAYEISQKAVLINEVALLSNELSRPVSSKDLIARWGKYPDRRPILSQAIGQLLIKAARPNKGGYPVLYQVGIIGNLAFYAADQSSRWHPAFRQHEIALKARQHARWGIPEQAIFLLGIEDDSLAKNALSGFIAEWAPIAADKTLSLPNRIHDLLEAARTENPGNFQGRCPTLISRKDAIALIAAEMEARNPFCSGSANYNRHLANLAWPMTSLFTQNGYWDVQVRDYCASKWPTDEDFLSSRARWLCGAYGSPSSF